MAAKGTAKPPDCLCREGEGLSGHGIVHNGRFRLRNVARTPTAIAFYAGAK